jgi:hypothetical protein
MYLQLVPKTIFVIIIAGEEVSRASRRVTVKSRRFLAA